MNISNLNTTTRPSRRQRGQRKTGEVKKQNEKKQIVNMVKSIVGQDKQLKWQYNDSGTTAVNSSGAFYDITGIGIGTAYNQRVGSSIKVREVNIDLQVILADTTNLFRLIVFKWIPSTSTDVPQTSELLDLSGSNNVQSTFLRYAPSRFKVLLDHVVSLDVAHVCHHTRFRIPLNFTSEFDLGTSTGRNHVYAYYVTDSGGVPHPSMDLVTQIQWHDTE